VTFSVMAISKSPRLLKPKRRDSHDLERKGFPNPLRSQLKKKSELRMKEINKQEWEALFLKEGYSFDGWHFVSPEKYIEHWTTVAIHPNGSLRRYEDSNWVDCGMSQAIHQGMRIANAMENKPNFELEDLRTRCAELEQCMEEVSKHGLLQIEQGPYRNIGYVGCSMFNVEKDSAPAIWRYLQKLIQNQ
jgi:hypothetical protein